MQLKWPNWWTRKSAAALPSSTLAEEDVVVDRRVIPEEEEQVAKGRRYSELKEGDTVSGTVRSLTDYGAFVNIGGIDALLHIGDISWSRVNKSSDVLSEGQQIEAKILKIDSEKRKVSIGMKQLLAASVGFDSREIENRRAHPRHSHSHHRLRRICGSGTRSRRPDPRFGNVLGEEGS